MRYDHEFLRDGQPFVLYVTDVTDLSRNGRA